MTQKTDLSLILACYNDALYLEESLNEIFKVLDMTRLRYEIIFVYDCGSDNTLEVIERLIKLHGKNKAFKKIVHRKNMGRGKSVRDGMRIAQGDVVGYIDVDMDIHARYIPSMVSAIADDGYDAACAFRYYRMSISPLFIFRHVLSHGYRFISRYLLDERLKDSESGFKFFDRKKIMPLVNISRYNGWFWDTEIMAYCIYRGLKIKEISCVFDRRSDKASSVNIINTVASYARSLTKFKLYLMNHKKERLKQ
ncbi:glycosyltransferase family 2 protein [Candidatus Omnitrophota bacterium]